MGSEREECERVFKRFDVNGDGNISLSEFADALKVLGLTSQEEVERRMAEIDKDVSSMEMAKDPHKRVLDFERDYLLA
ncbi:Polcalcin Phl p 7 [Glycine max]|nr:Polcalcin Phl p 7 [Glycine max]